MSEDKKDSFKTPGGYHLPKSAQRNGDVETLAKVEELSRDILKVKP